jgi:hypothetical protein
MKNPLKTVTVFFLLITSLSACQQQAEVSTMLENEATRNEIFVAIVADHEYSQELMDKMMENDHTQMMMNGNDDMMNMMMSDNTQLESMMKENPEMMHGIMSNMMNMADADSSMCANMMIMMKDKRNIMGQMMEMMHKEGIMVK